MSKGKHRWMIGFGIVAAVVLAGSTVLTILLSRARVSGDTPGERIECIARLTADGGFGAGSALANAAVNDDDARVRLTAVQGLAKFIGPDVRAAVEQCTRDGDPAVRSAAAAVLLLFADDPAVHRVVEMAQTDPDAKARLDAMTALAQTDADEAVVTLVEAMDRGRDAATRSHAVVTLARKYGLDDRALAPADRTRWLQVIEAIKSVPKVGGAFKRLDRPLERRPKDAAPAPAVH